MTIKKMPLKVVQQYSKLHKEIKKIVLEYYDFVEVTEESNSSITVKDKDGYSEFFFKVSAPSLNVMKVVFIIEWSPKSSVSNSVGKSTVEFSKVIEHFNQWLEILLHYELVTFSDEDVLINEYFKEQTDFFLPLNVDDANSIFSISQQLKIDNFIIKGIELTASMDAPEVANEFEIFRNDIGRLTKSQLIKKLNTVLAKARVKSFPLFKKLIELLMSETFSFVVQTTLTKMIQG